MIGIGLNDEKDITVKGLEIVKRASKVFLENYTSILQVPVSKLEEFYGCKIILADRDMVEKNSDLIIEDNNVFLVVGDVFSATTHTDLKNRALEKGLSVNIVNNASVLNAIGITGLELYKFGKVTSIPFVSDGFEPETPYNVLKENGNLHTLLLLDLHPSENKFMTVNEAIKYMLMLEDKKKEGVFTSSTMCLGVARLGGDYFLKYGKASSLLSVDFGKPPHCLIVPGKLHFVEEEELEKLK